MFHMGFSVEVSWTRRTGRLVIDSREPVFRHVVTFLSIYGPMYVILLSELHMEIYIHFFAALCSFRTAILVELYR